MSGLKIGNINFDDTPVVLAPMEGVTDAVFRGFCKQNGADWVYSEFISSEGLVRNAEKSLLKTEIQENERPVSIQIFGHDEDNMRRAVDIVAAKNPDFIDVNCGCPVKKVVRNGAGAALLKEPDKMIRIIKAVVEASPVPVTVKTRIGWDHSNISIIELSEKIQDTGAVSLALHARTARQMYGGRVDWTWFLKVKENQRFKIPLIGNGDVKKPEDALKLKNDFGVDGIMIGRASYGNPWIFDEVKSYLNKSVKIEPPTIEERIKTCREHAILADRAQGDRGVFELRKHFKPYFKTLKHFKPFRIKLLQSENLEGVMKILDEVEEAYLT